MNPSSRRMQRATWTRHPLRRWGARLAVAVGVAVALRAVATETPRFNRKEDPIVVRGADLAPLTGHPTQALRLLAVREGQLVPIPFQIDKRDAKGAPILELIRERENRPWHDNPALERHPNLEADDELALLAGDLGPRIAGDHRPAGPAVEIAATDPLNGASAYAYLVEMGTNAPHARDDYVSYDAERRIIQSADLSYGRCDPKHPAVIDYLTIGGSSNILNRLRSNMRVSAVFGSIGTNRDENDVETRLLSYTDGPVRVLLRQESRIAGIFWMQSDWVQRLIVNYPTRIEVPTRIRIPFRPGLLLTDVRAEVILEFNNAGANLDVSHPAVDAPIPLSVGATNVEFDVDLEKYPSCWIWGPSGGLLASFREDPQFAAMKLSRRFACHPATAATEPDAPEPGHASVEMHVTGIENLQRGTYDFQLVLSARRNLRPEDQRELEQIDHDPLRISTTPLQPEAAPGTNGEERKKRCPTCLRSSSRAPPTT